MPQRRGSRARCGRSVVQRAAMDMGNRLYVGNLPFDATEKQIRSLVEGEGRTVTSIKIVTDRDTGRSRGFAFVDLENADKGHARDQAKGGFGSRGPMQQMPRGSTRGGGRGGTRGS